MDYNNPNSINPGTSYRPSGFLGGMTWMEDRQRYRDQAGLQDYMSGLEALLARDKYSEYGLDAPVRAAERPAKISESQARAMHAIPRSAATLEQLTLGNDTTRQSNEFTRQTQPGKIAATNQAQSAATAQGRNTEANAHVEWLNQQRLGIESANSGLEQDMLWQKLRLQAPEEMRHILPEKWGPQAITVLKKMEENLMNNPAQRREMAKQILENQGRENVAHIQGGYGTQRAEITAEASMQRAIAVQQLKSQMVNSLEALAARAVQSGNAQLAAKAAQMKRMLDSGTWGVNMMLDPEAFPKLMQEFQKLMAEGEKPGSSGAEGDINFGDLK